MHNTTTVMAFGQTSEAHTNKEFIIIFGSSVTGCYRYGETEPSDIDVISDMSLERVKDVVDTWAIKHFGKELKIDLHEPNVEDSKIQVPMLGLEGKEEYIILQGNPSVKNDIYTHGFASILRLYNNDEILEMLHKEGPSYLSLLPPEYSYFGEVANMDKYCSGLQAYRNAAHHHENLKELFAQLNCGELLERLLVENPTNWIASPDLSPEAIPGYGWNHAYTITISADKTRCPLKNMTEKEAIDLIFADYPLDGNVHELIKEVNSSYLYEGDVIKKLKEHNFTPAKGDWHEYYPYGGFLTPGGKQIVYVEYQSCGECTYCEGQESGNCLNLRATLSEPVSTRK